MEPFDANDTFEQNIFFELRKRVAEQGVDSYDEYADLVDQIIQEKVEDGILTKHDDLTQMRSDLERRWDEIENTVIES